PFALSSTHNNTRRLFVGFLFSTAVIDSHVCAAVLLLLFYSAARVLVAHITSSLALTLRKAQANKRCRTYCCSKQAPTTRSSTACTKSERWTKHMHRTTLYERRT
ncbi:unnamed protein product, partial [Ectocarpus sp. 12 AP-2014]